MDTDILFSVRNNFYLGAFEAAIAEAADLDVLSESQKDERDVFVYRSYIELGSYEVSILPACLVGDIASHEHKQKVEATSQLVMTIKD